jgi:hypothetical protein
MRVPAAAPARGAAQLQQPHQPTVTPAAVGAHVRRPRSARLSTSVLFSRAQAEVLPPMVLAGGVPPGAAPQQRHPGSRHSAGYAEGWAAAAPGQQQRRQGSQQGHASSLGLAQQPDPSASYSCSPASSMDSRMQQCHQHYGQPGPAEVSAGQEGSRRRPDPPPPAPTCAGGAAPVLGTWLQRARLPVQGRMYFLLHWTNTAD